jgi:hypothetical protein
MKTSLPWTNLIKALMVANKTRLCEDHWKNQGSTLLEQLKGYLIKFSWSIVFVLSRSEHFKGSNIDIQQVLAFFKILISHISTISKSPVNSKCHFLESLRNKCIVIIVNPSTWPPLACRQNVCFMGHAMLPNHV